MCFHCGLPCVGEGYIRGPHHFCCVGCRLVHELLTESGLSHFYDLGPHPGAPVRAPARGEQWAHLDRPELQRQILDFSDGEASRVTFHLPAIHCVACVWLLENLGRLHPGVGATQVNFPKREAAIRFDPAKIKLSELVALLASIGYEPQLTLGALNRAPPNRAGQRQALRLGVAGFAFGNIMLLSLPGYFGWDGASGPLFRRQFGWLSLLFATPVLVYSAGQYWRSAWTSLRARTLTLEVPIALGLAALFAQSAFEVATGRGVGYLDSLVGLVFFLLCGRWFQNQVYQRLAFERDYKAFFPLSVMRYSPTGLAPAALADVGVGDRLSVRHGELIPTDARLLSGPACIDYSFVTGEAEPTTKEVGDYLYAGGRQLGGAIDVEVIKPVSQGYLTSLWNSPAFQKERDHSLRTLTNRYSRRFTLVVVAWAIAAALGWLVAGQAPRALRAFTSVLIVACPCALALAAPFALGTAQRLLARRHVFLKNSVVLERMAQVDTIVFDKTGTLTATRTSTVSYQGAPLSAAERRWLAALTRQSTHPYSAQIARFLDEEGRAESVTGFREVAGRGIEGEVQGRRIRLGSRAWLLSEARDGTWLRPGQLSPSEPHIEAAKANDSPEPGGSVVWFAIDGQERGQFVLSSTLRPHAEPLLANLAQHYELALLSGDHAREREQFAALFGHDGRLHFNQGPHDKLGSIQRLQDSGRTVMMVGDGLNDAGALKQSDVGVAVVEQVGTFSPASDVILEAGQVRQLEAVLGLARHATRIVRVSFGISALYNAAGLSIAAAGFLSPLICAILMPLSSISVVLFACGATGWAARRQGFVQ